MSIKHYEGVLGVFDYDDEVFEVRSSERDIVEEGDYLSFINKNNLLSVNLPKGCINTRFMFSDCTLPTGFSLGDNFDISSVESIECMFYECIIPEGFSLGCKFDTSNVKSMRGMFFDCTLPKDFSLGDKFDTSNVKDMSCMFEDCTIPEGFTLGDKFDTSNVENMEAMFYKCTIPKGFSLGNKFDTSNVRDMCFMFFGCTLPEDFDVTKYDIGTKEGIEKLIKSFNEYSKSKNLEACTRDLVKLLKEGKTVEESKKILAETYSYPIETISSCVANVNAKFSDKCIETLENLLTIDYNKTYSKYSVEEVRQILIGKGYPKDIVNDCIVTYLGSQHLV